MGDSQPFRHLLIIEELNQSKRTIVLEENTYSLGRHSSNSIPLFSRLASRHHATLLRVTYPEKQHDVFWLIDGNLQGDRSANGIFVNGKRCLSHELRDGDLIHFTSDVKALFRTLNTAQITWVNPRTENSDVVETHSGLERDEAKITIAPREQLQEIENFNSEVLFFLTNLPDLLPDPVVEIDFEGNIVYQNAAATQRFSELASLKLDHPVLRGILNLLPVEQEKLFVRQLIFEQQVYEQYVHYLHYKKQIKNYLFDFTKRKQIEVALQESEERYRAVIRQISEGILLVDADSKQLLEANPAYCQLLGYSLDALLQLTLYDIIVLDREIVDTELERILSRKLHFIVESVHRCQNGSLIPVEVSVSSIHYGGRDVLCFAVRDITERKQSQAQLEYYAFHDTLTQLPNRARFNEILTDALIRAHKQKWSMGILFLDLDRFKIINDTLGHATGDLLLQSFAHRLKSCLRGGDTVARWGGDEFTILLPQIQHPEDAAKICRRILDALKRPFDINDQSLHICTSIGIALYPQDGKDGETLLKHADAALYRAKEQGRSNYNFYSPTMSSMASTRLKLETLLHEALEKQQFVLHYQPQINIVTGHISSMEALLRWYHPDLGPIPPTRFIPLAEETNLILPIGEWVLETACRQNYAWQEAGFAPLRIAVNLSPRQFQQSDLVERISRLLARTRLAPGWLELEITENSLMLNIDFARQLLQQLHGMGVCISMDDFGTGYSSLSYLKYFPFDCLKIDQSFIRDLKDCPADRAIIAATLTLGRGFNLRVVAEGVETKQQLELLHTLGCEEMQGYWLSYPLNPQQATEFIASRQPSLPLNQFSWRH